MNLTSNSETFFFKDHHVDGRIYRIFNYRLASYSEWLHLDALECRGHTFEIDIDGNSLGIVCFPPSKFFNVDENPMTMGLNFHNPKQVMVKMDGSLISTVFRMYSNESKILLKSKGSFTSDQAIAATEWINRPENESFKSELFIMTNCALCTVNMEWVSPDNRIVIGYSEPRLVVLSVRNMETGEYLPKNIVKDLEYDKICDNWVETLNVFDPVQFVQDIAGMSGIEGFVIELESGQYVKIKAEAYLVLHRTKDCINSPRRLYEVVLEDASDDLKSLFNNDALAMKQILEMELKVSHLYNHLVASIELFYETNKDLTRKDYAIKGQEELPSLHFSLAMQKFLGVDVDYKAFMKKKWKEFGIKDQNSIGED